MSWWAIGGLVFLWIGLLAAIGHVGDGLQAVAKAIREHR